MKIVDDNGNIPKEDLSPTSVDFKNAEDVACEKCECKIFSRKNDDKKDI